MSAATNLAAHESGAEEDWGPPWCDALCERLLSWHNKMRKRT